jgi:hypothetical protein
MRAPGGLPTLVRTEEHMRAVLCFPDIGFDLS